jgi:hypothetical protein
MDDRKTKLDKRKAVNQEEMLTPLKIELSCMYTQPAKIKKTVMNA